MNETLLINIGWFFFDLLLLGYVEDTSTGISFCRVDKNEEIYIEVRIPVYIVYVSISNVPTVF